MGNRIISFYQYMMDYPHSFPDRLALAAEMQRLASDYPEIERIDSMMDLFNISRLLKDGQALEAVSGNLWCEYCAASGHEVS